MVRLHDVAIVGSGPAGSTCARYLARAGYDVVIIDRERFPRDKPCGGAFSHVLIEESPYLKKRENDFLECVSRVGTLHSPNRRITLSGRMELAMVLRYNFDAVLHEEAVTEGAIPLVGHRARSVAFHDDCASVTTVEGECICAHVIVGADGVNSLVARTTGLNRAWRRQDVTACHVVEVPVDENQITDIYGTNREYSFYANIGGQPGYGWVFPKRRTVNIGLGIVGAHSGGLPHKFRSFVRMLELKGMIPVGSCRLPLRGALVPTGGTISRSYSDRCLLVGDSAGMVNPLTGGGIAYALRAGRYAAKVLGHCIDSQSYDASSLSRYESVWQADFGKGMGRLLLAQKMFTSPLTDLMFHIGSRDPRIRAIVTDAMSEARDSGVSLKQLGSRLLWVCLREALHITKVH